MQLSWLYLIGSPEYKKLLSGKIQLQPVAVEFSLSDNPIHDEFIYFYLCCFLAEL